MRWLFSFKAASTREDDRGTAVPFVGPSGWSVSVRKWKKDREKVVYKRTAVKVQHPAPFIPRLTPLLWVSLLFISLLFFLTPSVSLSLYLSYSISSFFFPLPPSAAVTDFFLPCLKYEYFRAKKLKGNNEMAPKLNYPPFPESQKRDFSEWWAHWCHVGVSFPFSHTHMSLLSSAFVSYL